MTKAYELKAAFGFFRIRLFSYAANGASCKFQTSAHLPPSPSCNGFQPQNETEEHGMKEYFIKVGKDRIPVSQEVYEEHYKSKERMKYIQKLESVRLISYDQALEDGLPIETLMIDQEKLVADIVLNRLMIEKLLACIQQLLDDEQDLLRELYFNESCMRAAAKKLNLSLGAMQRKKALVLKKLKKILENC
jgi:DNA-directed RNA polymerase specialized sigma subunit